MYLVYFRQSILFRLSIHTFFLIEWLYCITVISIFQFQTEIWWNLSFYQAIKSMLLFNRQHWATRNTLAYIFKLPWNTIFTSDDWERLETITFYISKKFAFPMRILLLRILPWALFNGTAFSGASLFLFLFFVFLITVSHSNENLIYDNIQHNEFETFSVLFKFFEIYFRIYLF